MRYFRLVDDVNIPGRWHVGEITGADGASHEFDAGAAVDVEGALSAGVTHEGRALEFSLTSFAVPVASRALAEAIADVAGRDVQRIALKLGGRAGFEVLNATRSFDCLDETRSEFVEWTAGDHRADLAGQYRMVPRLHVDARRIPADARLFRVARWSIALVVTEDVKAAMERVGCLGAKFLEVT
jgi:hypothetical protein